MPNSPLRPCNKCTREGKVGYVQPGHVACAVHEKELHQRANAGRRRAYKRSSGWEARSREYRAIHTLCELCGEPSQEVHHIVDRKHGGSDDDTNLQALCKSCHSRITAQERGQFRLRRRPYAVQG